MPLANPAARCACRQRTTASGCNAAAPFGCAGAGPRTLPVHARSVPWIGSRHAAQVGKRRQLRASTKESAANSPGSSGATGAQQAQAPPSTSAGVGAAAPALLRQPASQSLAFALLASSSALLAALSLAAPELLLSLCYSISPGYADVAFLRISGAALLLSVAIEYCLKDACDNNRLSSATYQRLLLLGALKSVAFLAILATSPAAWTPAVLAFYPPLCVAGAAIYYLTLLASNGSRFTLPSPALSLPTNPAAWAYTAAAVLYLPTAAACFLPQTLFVGDVVSPQALFVEHTWAPSFLAAGGVCWVQKDAADRGRLGASTFRYLNYGLAALELGFSCVVGAAILSGHVVPDEQSLPSLATSSAIAAFALYQAVAADKQ